MGATPRGEAAIGAVYVLLYVVDVPGDPGCVSRCSSRAVSHVLITTFSQLNYAELSSLHSSFSCVRCAGGVVGARPDGVRVLINNFFFASEAS